MWVFAYGSLMWRPGFDYVEVRPALLRGYHRALCVYSHIHRGTPECPGLVLGLDRGGSCRGVAFRVEPDKAEEVMEYLYAREMMNFVYHPRFQHVSLPDGPVKAHMFVVDRSHRQYAGKLSDRRTVDMILQGDGKSGKCFAYVENTVEHLDELGIPDRRLHRVLRMARDRRSSAAARRSA